MIMGWLDHHSRVDSADQRKDSFECVDGDSPKR